MSRIARPLVTLASILLATGCGGGGGGDAAPNVEVVAGPGPAPAPSPSATSPATPAPAPAPTGWAAALYDVAPDPAGCTPGRLKDSVKAQFLADLNRIRALHALPPVTYSPGEDAEVAAASLVMALARQLSHTPPREWACWSQGASDGAGTSNLVGGWGRTLPLESEDAYLALWLNEGGSAQTGHRRWILNPFLEKTSYGRVAITLADGTRASAATMRVFRFAGGSGAVGGVPAFVAYPYQDYPARYFRPTDHLSFTAIANRKTAFGSADVGFARASITVAGPDGDPLPVADVAYDNHGYGVPNNIQWRVVGLEPGVEYTVTIAGVTGAPQTTYRYTFRIV